MEHPMQTPTFTTITPSKYPSQSSISDCESGVTGPSSSPFSSTSSSHIFPHNLMVKLTKEEKVYHLMARRFLSCVGPTHGGENMTVVAIHRRNWAEPSSEARLQVFQLNSRCWSEKNGGGNMVRFAWYGSEKQSIEKIFEHGFSVFDVLKNNNDNHGAIFLAPDHSPQSCLEDSIEDEDGLRHIVLCRVVMGRPELVQIGSGQTHPSSPEFDSGVDNLDNPSKYIIWSTNMNLHILPEYVISFRVENPKPLTLNEELESLKIPRSPWMSFPSLLKVLEKYLPHSGICLIHKFHKDYKDRKITRRELIQRIRQIAGDKLLIFIIKSCRGSKDWRLSMDNLCKRLYNQK